jgi:hypothetical protein
MKRYLNYFVRGIVFSSVVMLIGCDGFEGLVFEKVSGRKIPGVRITFVSEDGSTTRSVTTGDHGFYRISLGEGRYWVTATHRDYEDYSSFPGFFVVIAGGGYQTGNIALREPRVTTVLLVRHAESGEAGKQRAETLAYSAFKADVTAIYASPTKETVQRLADVRGLKVNSYNADDVQGFVNQLLSEHAGEVVVVAGENETLSEIIKKLGGSPLPPMFRDEYDNLFVITVPHPGEAKVISLQYGEQSP